MEHCWLTGCSFSELLYSPWIPCLQGLVPVSCTDWTRDTQTTLVPTLLPGPREEGLSRTCRNCSNCSCIGGEQVAGTEVPEEQGTSGFPLCRKDWTPKKVESPKYSCCPAKEHRPQERLSGYWYISLTLPCSLSLGDRSPTERHYSSLNHTPTLSWS